MKALFAALWVSLLLLSQLASAGHYVLVAHHMCDEHGSVHHGTPELVASSDEGASPIDAATQPTPDEHHHDDCHWMSRTADAVLETAALRVQVVETQSRISVSVRAADAVAALAILSLAPKQSPTVTA
jgi:hypothetical protein